ncbi:DEKNAAC103278 [Brettanomyces naardenensis]|uniref:Cysteine proteinase 1, mitochondrial n=1 Tax=Brettanomyces naardenensis TaxID=13370 RepID=A0A448YMU4_BRENA|nr:DEKNAAC103278 [Brettanomyces naardenensis]
MGNNPSTPVRPTYTYYSRPASEDDELVLKLQTMLLSNSDDSSSGSSPSASSSSTTSPLAPSTSASNPITTDKLYEWKDELLSEPKNQLALNCFTGNDITKIIAKNAKINKNNQDLFNVNIKYEGNPITNQKSSGRCWLFASTNVFKEFIKSRYNIEEFEFSQNYLFFYDKLEKSNWFLNRILESSDEDIDSRLVQFLLQSPQGDGGQWDMVINLVTRYGLVPKTVYNDSASSLNSGRLNYLVNEKLREFALILRKINREQAEKMGAQSIESTKKSMLQEIFNILSLTLGVPPKPDEKIVWEYKDKNGNYSRIETTPVEFYKDLLGFKADQYFSLIHDPRNVEGLYTVDKLGNIEGGKSIEYVNTSVNNLKQAAIAMLNDNHPVFFGSDVGKFEDTTIGLLDTKAWDYQLGFGTDINLTKKQRLLTGSSQMTHAMVLTGVHLVDGKPIRWKVENSWGEYGDHKGYFVMTDKWFDQYVFQVVTNEKYALKKLTDYWKGKEYKVLPYYDPMGALARCDCKH